MTSVSAILSHAISGMSGRTWETSNCLHKQHGGSTSIVHTLHSPNQAYVYTTDACMRAGTLLLQHALCHADSSELKSPTLTVLPSVARWACFFLFCISGSAHCTFSGAVPPSSIMPFRFLMASSAPSLLSMVTKPPPRPEQAPDLSPNSSRQRTYRRQQRAG